MTRDQLEHVIRAAATIADDDDIIVFGSQSILGQHPDAPADLLVSNEADIYPRNRPERADLVDGSIGELSPFHETFGYYAQGVDEGTAILPEGWKDRLVAVHSERTRGATGWCLEPADLVVAKCVAGREKDRRFVLSVLAHGLVDVARMRERLAATPLSAEQRNLVGTRLSAWLASSSA